MTVHRPYPCMSWLGTALLYSAPKSHSDMTLVSALSASSFTVKPSNTERAASRSTPLPHQPTSVRMSASMLSLRLIPAKDTRVLSS